MTKLLLGCLAVMAVSGVADANGVCVNTVTDITVTPPVSINSQGLVTLQGNPNLNAGGSENLWFTVAGSLNSLSLAAAGTTALVTERACTNSIATSGNTANLCSNTAQRGHVHILESINAGGGGSLSALYEGFGDPSAVPEPITFVLLGSALAFLGIVGRRLRKD